MTTTVGEEQAVVVGLGEYHVTSDPSATLICYGIGSCIAFAAYDPTTGVAAMAHFVLPDSSATARLTNESRFCDSGVPLILREMEASGATRAKIIVKIAGGAHMTVARGFEGRMNIGERNIESCKDAMTKAAVRCRGEDVGGTHGRTVRLYVNSGKVLISNVGGDSYEL